MISFHAPRCLSESTLNAARASAHHDGVGGGESHVALILAFGPEVRAFLHSGFGQRLASHARVTVLTANPCSLAFAGMTNLDVVALPLSSEPGWLQRLRYWVDLLHEVRMRVHGRTKWLHYLPAGVTASRRRRQGARVFNALGRLPWVLEGSRQLERWLGRRFGTCGAWATLIGGLGIDCIVTDSYANARTLPALQTAANLGTRVVVVANSWKDVYSKPRVPVVPDRIGVWSAGVRKDLLQVNSHVPARRTAICGLLHLERFYHPTQVIERPDFCARVGLDPYRPYVCYTAGSPAAVKNEPHIVAELLQAVQSGVFSERPQVLLRTNPMEDGTRFRELAARYSDLVIQRPVWEWDAAKDWNCALPEDTDLWVATVFHAALNVSIPSTVTLEFAALGRPVVNVCFDLPGPLPPGVSNRRFWDADFYREVRGSGYASPAFSPGELLELVSQALRGGGQRRDTSSLFPCREPVEAVAGLIESLMSQ